MENLFSDEESLAEKKKNSDFSVSNATSDSEEPGKDILVTSEELQELETNEIFTNGREKDNDKYESDIDNPNDEIIVCSECGALVNPLEITHEGCTLCGGQQLNQ